MTAAGAVNGHCFIECPDCRARFRIHPQLLDTAVRCAKCGGAFRAKEAAAPTPVLKPETAKRDPLLDAEVGNFRILSVLGRGAMGTVYEAEDTMLRRKVALKMLLPEVAAKGTEATERFLEEARAAAQLHHQNVVVIHQIGAYRDQYFIAMELVRGGNAAEFILEHGPMTPLDATRSVIECAKALADAHAQGLLHRDVKPDNIMLGPRWSVKLADFGLATPMHTGREKMAFGTPGYMSPEACSGGRLDARTDLYSLGATYFCLLTGRPPFIGRNPQDILKAHLRDDPPDPRLFRPGLPQGCVDVINKALNRDLNKRYQTADEMIEELSGITFSKMVLDVAAQGRLQRWATRAATIQAQVAGESDHLPFAAPEDESKADESNDSMLKAVPAPKPISVRKTLTGMSTTGSRKLSSGSTATGKGLIVLLVIVAALLLAALGFVGVRFLLRDKDPPITPRPQSARTDDGSRVAGGRSNALNRPDSGGTDIPVCRSR